MIETATHPAVLLVLGLLVAAVGSSVGVGGGFFVVPYLLIAAQMDHAQAVAISLVVVTVSAISAVLGYARQKRIDYVTAGLFILATLPGSALGAWLTTQVHGATFQLLLAILLIGAAVATVALPRSEAARKRTLKDRRLILKRTYRTLVGERVPYRVDLAWGMIASLVLGVVGGFFGIGGGIVFVPFMFLVLGVPFRIAVPTSTAILVPKSVVALATLWGQGVMPGEPALWLGIGSVVGGVIGATLTARIRGYFLRGVLAAVLVGVAVLMAVKYFNEDL